MDCTIALHGQNATDNSSAASQLTVLAGAALLGVPLSRFGSFQWPRTNRKGPRITKLVCTGANLAARIYVAFLVRTVAHRRISVTFSLGPRCVRFASESNGRRGPAATAKSANTGRSESGAGGGPGKTKVFVSLKLNFPSQCINSV